ncbi:MAG: UDP-N-acetylmuramoyl-L-alanine--D-glutamate ligase, partial [Dysgonamonadaceae bacterium]|nr:UDP-N-acetylmuramoyl-L-alanine--D-glutamate ligase [Dysgonamonadaceae bacterium]
MQPKRLRLVVLGGGESGVGAAVLAKKEGFDVFLSDSSEIKLKYKTILDRYDIVYEECRHTESLILNADEVVKSPGIPDNVFIINKLTEHCIPIISEIEFAGRYTSGKTVCVTGSNGKTTTATLIWHILSSSGLDVGLVGNIGSSFALQVAERDREYYVIELSSFQLDRMYGFRADIAVLLNITPDHLDRYEYDFGKYVASKMRILQNQTSSDAFIYWGGDKNIKNSLERLKPEVSLYSFDVPQSEGLAGYVSDGNIIIETLGRKFIMEEEFVALTGKHNIHNTLSAGIAASLLDISDENLRRSLSDFKGVEHRLEMVACVRGVEYINDSKATNVNAVWYALESMKTPVVLILGGVDKGNDYMEIELLIREKCRALVFLGTDNMKLHEFFDGKVPTTFDALSMREAVRFA